jgi:hypothetical protein
MVCAAPESPVSGVPRLKCAHITGKNLGKYKTADDSTRCVDNPGYSVL